MIEMSEKCLIVVRWKDSEVKVEVRPEDSCEAVTEKLRKSFKIPEGKTVAGLSNEDDEMLDPQTLSGAHLASLPSRKYWLLLASNSQSGSNNLSRNQEKKSMRVQDSGSDSQQRHQIQLQEVSNIDSFISTILNDINPTTRILLIKLRNKKRLELLVGKSPAFEQKISSRC